MMFWLPKADCTGIASTDLAEAQINLDGEEIVCTQINEAITVLHYMHGFVFLINLWVRIWECVTDCSRTDWPSVREVPTTFGSIIYLMCLFQAGYIHYTSRYFIRSGYPHHSNEQIKYLNKFIETEIII